MYTHVHTRTHWHERRFNLEQKSHSHILNSDWSVNLVSITETSECVSISIDLWNESPVSEVKVV